MQWLWGGKLQLHFRMSDAGGQQLYLLQDRLCDAWISSSKSLFSVLVRSYGTPLSSKPSSVQHFQASLTKTRLKESSVTSAEQHLPILRAVNENGYICHIKVSFLVMLIYTYPAESQGRPYWIGAAVIAARGCLKPMCVCLIGQGIVEETKQACTPTTTTNANKCA